MNKIAAVKQMISEAQAKAARFPDEAAGLRIAESKGLRIVQNEYARLLSQIMPAEQARSEAKRYSSVDEILEKMPDNYESGELIAGMTIEEVDDSKLDKIWESVHDNDIRSEKTYKRGKRKKPQAA